MKEKVEEKSDFVGRLYYNFSVLMCLPQSMEYPNSKATGAAMTPSTFRNYAKEAGFSKIDTLTHRTFYVAILSFNKIIFLSVLDNMLNTCFDTFANSILKIDMIFDIRDKKEYKTKELVG